VQLPRRTENWRRRNRRGFLLNQTLFTLRRFAYAGTLALVGMAGAVVKLGFGFDMMMETSQVAFTTLLQSTALARREINYLFELAAKTPFTFQGVQQAARYFLGWGFSIQEVNKNLAIMANVISGMGGNTSLLEPVIKALGQMRSAGVVRMQDLMQLQQALPGVMGILQRGLKPSGLGDGEHRRVSHLE
jgi:tape measure domain-containing protein